MANKNVNLPEVTESVNTPTKAKYTGNLAGKAGRRGKTAMEIVLCDAIESGVTDDAGLYQVFYERRKDTAYQSDKAAFQRYMKCTKMLCMMADRDLL